MPSLTLLGLSEAPREVCASSGRNVGASEGEASNAPRWDLARRKAKRRTKKKKEEEEDAMATSKEEMYAKFQPWVLATYGDSAKTKTITVRKAARIRALLSTSEKVKLIFLTFEIVDVEKNMGGQIPPQRSDLDGDVSGSKRKSFKQNHFFNRSLKNYTQ